MMMMELAHSTELIPVTNNTLRLLMVLSLIKDDLPWLYELAIASYQQTARQTTTAKQARQRVFDAVKMIRRGSWIEFFENKETYMIFRELDYFSHDLFDIENAETDASP
jgi:hypothetical protein